MAPGEIPYMKTLSECINSLVKQGFSENFNVRDNKLVGDNKNESYSHDKVHITSFYRFEGTSDPADNAILYAIETDDGKKGVLVDAYGSEADTKVTEFIKKVSDINKKVER
jgi:hypothetical protein